MAQYPEHSTFGEFFISKNVTIREELDSLDVQSLDISNQTVIPPDKILASFKYLIEAEVGIKP